MNIDINGVLSGDKQLLKLTLPLNDVETELFNSDDVDICLPITADVTVTNTAGLTELFVSADVVYATHCARCGKSLTPTIPIRLKQSVVSAISTEENDSILVVDGGQVDVTQLITEQISFELPMRHLCSEDCMGLCPSCGVDLNVGSCSCLKKETDGRLADLSKFFDEK